MRGLAALRQYARALACILVLAACHHVPRVSPATAPRQVTVSVSPVIIRWDVQQRGATETARVVVKIDNPTADSLFVARCGRVMLYYHLLPAGASDDRPVYEPVCALVEAPPRVIPPLQTTLDTVFVVRGTGAVEPRFAGKRTGEFQFSFGITNCRRDYTLPRECLLSGTLRRSNSVLIE